jgi:hypothetical protein
MGDELSTEHLGSGELSYEPMVLQAHCKLFGAVWNNEFAGLGIQGGRHASRLENGFSAPVHEPKTDIIQHGQ